MYSNGCGDCDGRNGLGDAYGRSRYRAPAPVRAPVAYARPLRPGERRASAVTTRGLGFDWRTVLIGGLQTGIGVATANPALVAGGATTAVGGAIQSGGSSTCSGQLDARTVAAKLNTIAERGEQAKFLSLLNASNPVDFTFNDLFQPERLNWLAWSAKGGSDCKVGTAAGRAWVAYWDSIPAEPQQYYTTMPVLRPDVDYPTTATQPPPVYDPGPVMTGSTAPPDAGPSIWDRIKEYAGDAARAAAEAAARAAAATTYTNLPATQRDQLEREIMLARGGATIGLPGGVTPWLIGGGLLVGAVLLSGGRGRR